MHDESADPPSTARDSTRVWVAWACFIVFILYRDRSVVYAPRYARGTLRCGARNPRVVPARCLALQSLTPRASWLPAFNSQPSTLNLSLLAQPSHLPAFPAARSPSISPQTPPTSRSESSPRPGCSKSVHRQHFELEGAASSGIIAGNLRVWLMANASRTDRGVRAGGFLLIHPRSPLRDDGVLVAVYASDANLPRHAFISP